MNQEKIGKFILKCRKNKKITQKELAEKLGVSDKTISNWENGRNMPDLSLFKPLCEELDITINDLISGEIVKEKDYQEKLEQNIINTIDYSNYKVNKNNKNIAWILIVIGVLLSVSALTIFPSESSWGSIYSVIGAIISLIGISKLTKKLTYQKRVLINYGYFTIFIIILILLDYIAVSYNKQPPRFSYEIRTIDNIILYKSPLCNVYRINRDKENEYYIIDNKKEYTIDTVPTSPFNREKAGIDNIIKYKTVNLDNIKIENIIKNLPLNEYNYNFKIDNNTITINYKTNNWYVNENYYLEKSLIYNSVSLFILVQDLNNINFTFNDITYKISRDIITNNYQNYEDIIKRGIDKTNFNTYLEEKIDDNDFIHIIFKKLFLEEPLKKTTKIILKTHDEKEINTITNKNEIEELINLISRSSRITGAVTLDGNWWNIFFYEEDELIYKLNGWGTHNNYSSTFGFDGKEYILKGLEGIRFREIIEK